MLELLLALEPGVSELDGLLGWRPTFPEVLVMGELLDVTTAEDLLTPAEAWLSLVPAASNSFSFLLRRFFLISAL